MASTDDLANASGWKSLYKVVKNASWYSMYPVEQAKPITSNNTTVDVVDSSKEEYGVTCVSCKQHNEFAIKKANHVCKSCKSYEDM